MSFTIYKYNIYIYVVYDLSRNFDKTTLFVKLYRFITNVRVVLQLFWRKNNILSKRELCPTNIIQCVLSVL